MSTGGKTISSGEMSMGGKTPLNTWAFPACRQTRGKHTERSWAYWWLERVPPDNRAIRAQCYAAQSAQPMTTIKEENK